MMNQKDKITKIRLISILIFHSTFIILHSTLISCVFPIENYKQPQSVSFLSIDGGISDQNGPHFIKLFYSSQETVSGNFYPIENAKVWVIDEKGIKTDFTKTELDLGVYASPKDFKGKIGNKYQLHFEINNKKYESSFEELKPCPEIKEVSTEITIKDKLSNQNRFYAGFDVSLTFQDGITNNEFYRWSWINYNKLKMCAVCRGTQWDPLAKNCGQEFGVARTKYRCTSTCWDIRYGNEINLFSDALSNGNEVKNLFVTRVPYVWDSISTHPYSYFLQVELRSINKNTYDFYRNTQRQTQENGSLFDVPTLSRFNYNITCKTDPNEKIQGIFEVYGVKKKSIWIDRSIKIKGATVQIDNKEGAECYPFPCYADCVEGLFRTKTKPDGWVE